MLKVGIVGKNSSELYIAALESLDNFKLIGVFDPSFHFESANSIKGQLAFVSFEELLSQVDVVIFASSENIYFPLIELAIKCSKAIFLNSAHNLSHKEQLVLLKLRQEAGVVLQINQPIVFSDVFKELYGLENAPLLINYNLSDSSERQLVKQSRLGISAVLSIFKSRVRKVSVNVISVLSEFSDVIKVRLDFDNGGVADIITDSVGVLKSHNIKYCGYNSYFEANLITNCLVGKNSTHNINKTFDLENDERCENMIKQLVDFYLNVFKCITPISSLENEIATQIVIEEVKEKLRISINID